MSNDPKNNLASLLIQDLKPSQIKKPSRTIVASLLLSFLSALIVYFVVYPHRTDLGNVASDPVFLFSTGVSLFTALISFCAIIFLAIPGKKSSINLLITMAVLLLGLAAGLAFWPNSERVQGMTVSVPCSSEALWIGSVTFLIFLFSARKFAPTRPALIGGLCGVAAATMGMVGVAFSCTSENATHLLIWHFLVPLACFSTIGAIRGSKLLRW